MAEKRKVVSAVFNAEEIEAIEKTCTELGITKSQMVKGAVTFWMMISPAMNVIENSHFGELLESISHKMKKTKSLDEEQYLSIIGKYCDKYGKSEIDQLTSGFDKADKNYHILKKKKKMGRPRIKKKRGRPKV